MQINMEFFFEINNVIIIIYDHDNPMLLHFSSTSWEKKYLLVYQIILLQYYLNHKFGILDLSYIFFLAFFIITITPKKCFFLLF